MAIVVSNELMLQENKLNYTFFDNLNEQISKKYKSRLVQSTDPVPIMIKCDITGPLTVTKGSIMCDFCGSIIRKNYLINHRNSGACARLQEKRKQQDLKCDSRLVYNGPYVNLKNSNDL